MGQDVNDVLVAIFSIVVCTAQIVLAVAGLFGHSVILFATYKTKEIQTKYGLLLVQLSVTHIICILGQLLNTAFIAKIFMRKNKNVCFRNQHRKTMRTISMLVVIYVCTWVLSLVLTNVMRFVTDSKWKRLMGMVTSVLQMMCFAQTFYVCYQRSSEYRNTFRRLFKSIDLLGKIKGHIMGYRNPACHPEKPPQFKTVSFVTAI